MFVNYRDWKWLLESFADRVADKEYKKTDYQVWRQLKNYNEAYIYYINGNSISVEEAEKEFDGKGYGDFKMAVGEAVADKLKPIQDRFYELQKDKEYIDKVVKENDEKAAYFANKTLRKVKKKVGLVEPVR